MNLKLLTAPKLQPVTLTEAKNYLRVDSDDDNERIENLIKAVTRKAEEFTRRAFITQTFEFSLDEAPSGVMEIPRAPLQSIVSITTYDDDGISSAFDLNDTWSDSHSIPGRIALKAGRTWPTDLRSFASFIIQFKAGYGDKPENVDEGIREAILRGVATFYANREDTIVGTVAAKLPEGAREMLMPYKVFYL